MWAFGARAAVGASKTNRPCTRRRCSRERLGAHRSPDLGANPARAQGELPQRLACLLVFRGGGARQRLFKTRAFCGLDGRCVCGGRRGC